MGYAFAIVAETRSASILWAVGYTFSIKMQKEESSSCSIVVYFFPVIYQTNLVRGTSV